ncbi:MAG TPA: bifunctional oligoribonuclease/PAP phosphatase NrnA [Acholeplasmataceae bacterium]|jgi:phosphoesterase RecJ-like protein|nr:bifunctional oligoribonuclease/PAP phosphatase NrnA [Acholeplasmataceae bacterium]
MNNYIEIKKQILDKIKAYDTIMIHRHVRPDGDCIGSSFGLRDILRTSFPEKKVYSVKGNDQADYLDFLGSEDEVNEEEYENALVIVVDTSTGDRISGENYKLGKEIIKIDHHIETDPYGNINYVREDYPSTTLLIMDFFKTFENELKMTKEGAKALYVGTITDTGRFRYSSVDGNSLRLAGDILDYGIDTEELFVNLYVREKNILKLQGYVLRHFKTTKNGVSYIYISKRLRNRFKVAHSDASSLVSALDNIKGSLIWILFIEAGEGIRVRLRSRYLSIVEVAQKFNGGGHAQASGASVRNKKEMKKLIYEADKLLESFKAQEGDKV